MNLIGLVMVNEEDDILAETLRRNIRWTDAFYVLDGTADNTDSEAICRACGADGYWRDRELPRPPYPERATDGYRRFIHEQAVAEHGPENWFALIHADEVWTFNPADVIAAHPRADGFTFPLPCYFPRGEWDDIRGPLEQLRWSLRPGWPEMRLFRGGGGVYYDPAQHFNVTPLGIRHIVHVALPINHYPFRSPSSQHTRAAATYDPDNYRDAGSEWDDATIADWQRRHSCFRELACDPA